MFDFFWKGLILGLAIAAPVGPIGILCIRKTLQFGKISGLCSGVGAAAADTLFGALAAFGLTVLSSSLLAWSHWLKLIGSFFLLFLSYRSFRTQPYDESKQGLRRMSLLKDFIGTFFLTLTNPLTFFCYFAVFAAMGLANIVDGPFSNILLITGVFTGATLWWLILSEGISLFRHKLNKNTMTWINRTAGVVLGIFALWSLASFFLR
jgi:threonine/homoserine/homoserine lactone efflux protein